MSGAFLTEEEVDTLLTAGKYDELREHMMEAFKTVDTNPGELDSEELVVLKTVMELEEVALDIEKETLTEVLAAAEQANAILAKATDSVSLQVTRQALS
ncbi:hypothetical protein BH11PAT4_BH11PAT4_2810 [soil metagenome]